MYALADGLVPTATEAGWVSHGGVHGPTDAECVRALLARSVQLMGIGTLDDVQDVYRLRMKSNPAHKGDPWVLRDVLQELIELGDVVPVEVEGVTWYADPAALAPVPATPRSVTTLLSPFDPIAWHRPRLERLFGLRMQIEAYTPKEQREHGYFAMPVLHEGRVIGLVDPAREGDALVARNISTAERDPEGFAIALADAARWVGKTEVRVERAPTRTLARDVARRATALLN